MVTSLLADKSVMVKFKLVMSFMIKIVNPSCYSLTAAFFELKFEGCQRGASSCSKTSVRPKMKLSQSFELLFPLCILLSLKKNLPEKEARRVLWEVQRDQLKKAVCARRRLVRKQRWRTRTFHIVCGVDEVKLSGYESEGFTLSEFLFQKRLAKKSVSEGVVDTAHLPQCEFSNLQHLPLTFLQELFAGQSLNSIRLVVLRALKREDDLMRLLCFSV